MTSARGGVAALHECQMRSLLRPFSLPQIRGVGHENSMPVLVQGIHCVVIVSVTRDDEEVALRTVGPPKDPLHIINIK